MAQAIAFNPLNVFSIEIWDLIIKDMEPSTFEVFRHAIPELYNFITPANFARKLFPSVFKVLYDASLVRPEDVKSCRQVCSDWKESVDGFFQTTNFNCIEKRLGPRNFSSFVLKMPMELVDIQQIHEMGMHPGCVSFGKKLTILMSNDRQAARILPNHLDEVDAVLQNSWETFWQRFEHLELRDQQEYRPRRQEDDNLPEEISTYLPFLHLLTNLKKITLGLSRRWHNIQFFRDILRTAIIEEIYMDHRAPLSEWHWSESLPVFNQLYARNVTFLAGVKSTCLNFYTDVTNLNNIRNVEFEKLKELHILVDEQRLSDSLSASTIESMFPNVNTLGISVGNINLESDFWIQLGTFVNKFPSLNHFSLSGNCISRLCDSFKTICETENSREVNVTASSIGLNTFQFQCPMHVPTGLLQQFPGVKRVIVEEWPNQCQRNDSKSNSLDFVNGFFLKFPGVTSLSFVPVTSGDEQENVTRSTGTVTHFKQNT